MGEQLELFVEPETTEPQEASPATSPSDADTRSAQQASLYQVIASHLGKPVTLTVTRNRQTMMSVRPQPGGLLSVRLHEMFLEASQEVWEGVAAWVKRPKDKAAGAIVDNYIRANAPRHPRRPRVPAALVSRGQVHDLQALYDEVNAAHFGGEVNAPITWGLAPHRHRRRYMRLGSYAPAEHLIRIHPHLDEDFVPVFFVRYIVFHEMLHAYLGIVDCGTGRRGIHTPAFRKLEREYPDFERAEAWLKNSRNLSRIMRARPV